MSFSNFLAPKQNMIWSLRRKGFEPVEIAKKLKTSRQFVHQTLKAADSKIYNLLTEVAQANKVEIQRLDVKNGILIGYHRGFETPVIVSYSSKHGVQVWYWHENPESCEKCEFEPQCRSYLIDESEERGIELTEDEKRLPPAKLARIVFSKLISGVKP